MISDRFSRKLSDLAQELSPLSEALMALEKLEAESNVKIEQLFLTQAIADRVKHKVKPKGFNQMAAIYFDALSRKKELGLFELESILNEREAILNRHLGRTFTMFLRFIVEEFLRLNKIETMNLQKGLLQ